MKITNLTAKFSNVKSNAIRVLAAATLAGAFLAAAAPAAQAQRVVLGVGFGGPRYFAPAPPVRFYGGPVYGYGYGYHPDWRFHHDYYRHGWR
jgi:hypothetical protein